MKMLLRREGWRKIIKQTSGEKKYIMYKRGKEYCEICYEKNNLIWYQVINASGKLRGYRNFISGSWFYEKDIKKRVDNVYGNNDI